MDVPYQTAIINKNQKFTTQTLSGYKRTDVTTAFEKAIKNGRMEEACTWMTELNASGFDLWKIFFKIAFNDINIANPYLPQFLKIRYRTYLFLATLFKKNNNIEMRNNQQVRNLLVDVTSTLTMSNHTTKLLQIALPKLTDKDLTPICYKNRLRSTNLKAITSYLYQEDPPELKMVFNEIINLFYKKDHTITSNSIIYWIQWIHKFDQHRRKIKQPLLSHSVKVKNINSRHHKEWVWILWKILLNIAKQKKIPPLTVQINSLFYLYKHNYTPASKQQKLPIFMTAVLYLHEQVNWQLPLYTSYKLRIKACAGINILYNLLTTNLNPQQSQDATTKALYNNIKKDVFYQQPQSQSHQSSQHTTQHTTQQSTQQLTKPKTKKELKAEQEKTEHEILNQKTEYFNIVPHKHYVANSIPPPPDISSIDDIKRLVI